MKTLFASLRRGRAGTALAALALACATAAPVLAAEDGYRLGPQDRIRLRVHEWRATQDQVFEWEALRGEFTVGAEGNLAIPLIGEVPVAGLLASEVASTIGAQMRDRMGLTVPPDASVEVVEFRPFYVAGEVTKPGPYAFRPGLTVLQATAIAGGILRPSDAGLMRLGKEVIANEGEINLLRQERDMALARRARLQAELETTPEISFPDDLARRGGDRAIILLMQQERLIFKARNEAFKAQTETLAELKKFLEKEAEALKAQLVTQDTQLELVNRELQSVSTLVEKGFAIAPRQLALERGVAQIQGDRLRLETELLRVRQESAKTDMAIIELRNKRANDLSVEMRETQARLEQIEQKTATSTDLLYEAEVLAPRMLADRIRGARLRPVYLVVRTEAGKTREIEANEGTPLEAGDTLKVDLPLPAPDPGGSAALLKEAQQAIRTR
ncbi:polysaccharide biosynthesis/export family protein [Azorhizobium oxalatiphilum]|nr:polysaccharide biosynthesis/export family protein [Azorhizobium oxalatiphilum]